MSKIFGFADEALTCDDHHLHPFPPDDDDDSNLIFGVLDSIFVC